MIVISAESADNLWVRQANSYKITFPQIPVMGGQERQTIMIVNITFTL